MRGLYSWLRTRSVRGLTAHFPERGLVVDLGCGVGALSRQLLRDAPERRVLAVDRDGKRLRALVSRGADPRLEVRHAAIEDVEIPPCRGVALVDVLHYLDRPTQEAVLARAAAALDGEGVVVLRDPDAGLGMRFVFNRAYERLATGVGFTRARIGAYRTAEDWTSALARVGLRPDLEPARGRLFADRVVVGRTP